MIVDEMIIDEIIVNEMIVDEMIVDEMNQTHPLYHIILTLFWVHDC